MAQNISNSCLIHKALTILLTVWKKASKMAPHAEPLWPSMRPFLAQWRHLSFFPWTYHTIPKAVDLTDAKLRTDEDHSFDIGILKKVKDHADTFDQ